MKNKLVYLCVLCLLCVACSHIDEDEQLIYVKPADVARCVLIEDFTGQNCLNCPTATLTIADLQEAYGHDVVVAVGIYSGDFGRTARGVPYSLTTETGDEYYAHWALDHQPVGLVNRHGASEYQDWGRLVREQLEQKSHVDLEANGSFNAEARQVEINVSALGTDGNTNGKLQVWLTEDNITDGQRLPDGTWNREYFHNHVFRDAVNGAWGTDFSIKEGEQKEESFTYTIAEDKDWKPENMNVVVFIYNDNGVEQVTIVKLVTED